MHCKHYNGDISLLFPTDEHCAAGVNIDATWGRSPGLFLRIPCTTKHKEGVTERLRPCFLRVLPTPAEQEEEKLRTEAMFANAMVGIVFIQEWKKGWIKGTSRQEVVQCPVCKGRLSLGQSSYNGHVGARCSTQGCINMLE